MNQLFREQGMLFGKDSFSVNEQGSGTVKSLLDAQAAAQSETASPLKVLVRGLGAAQSIQNAQLRDKREAEAEKRRKEAEARRQEALHKAAISAEIDKEKYDLLTSEEYRHASVFARRDMLESVLAKHAKDDDLTRVLTEKAFYGEFAKVHDKVNAELDRAALTQSWQAQKAWTEENPESTIESFISHYHKLHPRLTKDKIRDAVIGGFVEDATLSLDTAETQEDVNYVVKEIEATAGPLQVKAVLGTTSKKRGGRLVAQAKSALKAAISKKRKEISDVAKASLDDEYARIQTSDPEEQVIDPTINENVLSAIKEAYPGNKDGATKALAKLTKAYATRVKTFAFAQENPTDQERHNDPEKGGATSVWKQKVMHDGEQAYLSGNIPKLSRIATYNIGYVGDLKKNFRGMFLNSTSQEDLHKYVSTVRQLMVQPEGGVITKALYGDDIVSQAMILPDIANMMFGGDLLKARGFYMEKAANIENVLPSKLPKDLYMKVTEQAGKMPGKIADRFMEMSKVYLGVDPSGTLLKEHLGDVTEYFRSLFEERTGEFMTPDGDSQDVSYILDKSNGMPQILAAGGDMMKDALGPYLKEHMGPEQDIGRVIYAGGNNVMVYGSFGEPVGLYSLKDITSYIKGYAEKEYQKDSVGPLGGFLPSKHQVVKVVNDVLSLGSKTVEEVKGEVEFIKAAFTDPEKAKKMLKEREEELAHWGKLFRDNIDANKRPSMVPGDTPVEPQGHSQKSIAEMLGQQ